jgi:hypothetical protein
MTTFESTVLEKLFHEDHPMGGGVAGIWRARIASAAADDDGNDDTVAANAPSKFDINKRELTANATISDTAPADRFSIASSNWNVWTAGLKRALAHAAREIDTSFYTGVTRAGMVVGTGAILRLSQFSTYRRLAMPPEAQ